LEDDLPQIYFCNAGTVLRRTYLDKRLFYSTEVFVFVNPEFVSSELITIFPAASYACIYCDDFYNKGGMTQAEICQRTFQSKQTVNLIIRNLLSESYVTV
jgi:hypothetical protein